MPTDTVAKLEIGAGQLERLSPTLHMASYTITNQIITIPYLTFVTLSNIVEPLYLNEIIKEG